MGVISDFESSGARMFTFRGGIQRLLLALNAVPKFLIETTCGVFWTGFPVVGFDRRFWHCGEIVNLPVDRVFQPKDWWGLTHESAHVLLYLNEKWFPLDQLSQSMEQRLGRKLSGSEVVDISEMLLDVFDFVYCFDGDWEFYSKAIWSYLVTSLPGDEYISGRLGSYFLRSFTVYFFYHVTDSNAERLVTAKTLFDMYDSFFEELTRRVPKIGKVIGKQQLRETRSLVLRWFAAFRPVLPEIRKSVESYRVRFKKWDNTELRSNTEKALRLIRRGEVADGPVNPVQIIMELARNGRLQFSGEIATILTLWNEYLRTYHDELAFA
jgi:hypothetical protein